MVYIRIGYIKEYNSFLTKNDSERKSVLNRVWMPVVCTIFVKIYTLIHYNNGKMFFFCHRLHLWRTSCQIFEHFLLGPQNSYSHKTNGKSTGFPVDIYIVYVERQKIQFSAKPVHFTLRLESKSTWLAFMVSGELILLTVQW